MRITLKDVKSFFRYAPYIPTRGNLWIMVLAITHCFIHFSNFIFWSLYLPVLVLITINPIYQLTHKNSYGFEKKVFEIYTRIVTLNKAKFYGIYLNNYSTALRKLLGGNFQSIREIMEDIKISLTNKGIKCRIFNQALPYSYEDWCYIEIALLDKKDINFFRLTMDHYYIIELDFLDTILNKIEMDRRQRHKKFKEEIKKEKELAKKKKAA